MKQKIIKTIFIIIFGVYLILGIISFIDGHHTNIIDSISVILGAFTYLLSYLTLCRLTSDRETKNKLYLSDTFLKVSYITTFVLFIGISVLSFLIYKNSLAVTNMLLCAVTQIVGYRVFVKQSKQKQ